MEFWCKEWSGRGLVLIGTTSPLRWLKRGSQACGASLADVATPSSCIPQMPCHPMTSLWRTSSSCCPHLLVTMLTWAHPHGNLTNSSSRFVFDSLTNFIWLEILRVAKWLRWIFLYFTLITLRIFSYYFMWPDDITMTYIIFLLHTPVSHHADVSTPSWQLDKLVF
jgi:hypothetical protein